MSSLSNQGVDRFRVCLRRGGRCGSAVTAAAAAAQTLALALPRPFGIVLILLQ